MDTPLWKNWYSALYRVCPFSTPQLTLKRPLDLAVITVGVTFTYNGWAAVWDEGRSAQSCILQHNYICLPEGHLYTYTVQSTI